MRHTKRRTARGGRLRIVAITAGLVILVLAALWLGARATAQEGPPDFAMVAYHGEDRLGGSEVNLSDLLGRGEPVVLNF